jgi:hypothetical protein
MLPWQQTLMNILIEPHCGTSPHTQCLLLLWDLRGALGGGSWVKLLLLGRGLPHWTRGSMDL